MRKLSITSWLLVALVIIALDQGSKIWALQNLADTEVSLFSYLDLVLTQNAGAVFGILAKSSGWQRWFFTGFAFIMIAIIIVWQNNLKRNEGVESLALAMVLGGGVGNVIDRVRLGYVIDFIDVYYQQWHWYTFNVADIYICIGATILLMLCLFTRKNKSIFT